MMRRTYAMYGLSCGLALAAVAMLGCGLLPGRNRQSSPGSAVPAPSTPAATAPAGRFTEPADPCAAVAPATAQRFKMDRPKTVSLPGMDADPNTGKLVSYQNLKCSWSIDNPAKGPDGRPNYIDVTVTYSVIDRTFPTAVDVARGIYELRKEKQAGDANRSVQRTDSPTGLGDEASYSFAVTTSSLGQSGDAVLLILSSNATVSISTSGADLLMDRSKPVGHQLYTRPLAEGQLQATVLGIAGEVMGLLG
jgi:hypothetical protein